MSAARDLSDWLAGNRKHWLPRLFPDGRRDGGYFKVGGIDGAKGDSLNIPLNASKRGLRDFGNCWAGDDLKLLADHKGLSVADAMTFAYDQLGAPRPGTWRQQNGRTEPPPRQERDRPENTDNIRIKDGADDRPPERHPELGEPTFRHEYADAAGRLIFYHCRFDPPGRGKEFRPLAFRDGRWRWQDPAGLLPLYGLAELAARPGDPVLIVEGEKAADVARDLLPDEVVTTWPHGGKATAKVDWAPLAGRDVVLWPDNDDPGREAMAAAAKALRTAGARSVRIVELPDGLPHAWDLADELPEGLDVERIDELIAEAKAPAEPAEPGGLCLTPSAWAAREIPPPDPLLGDVFTTTTRAQLSADTGLGKTMFSLGTAFAMRLGADFLGWKGRRQSRVLVVDGEMPLELIQERLAAAASWFGVTEPIADGLFILSREDVEGMPPLDTQEGARWMLDFIGRLGKLDHVNFDNIAALTSGCMKEEESERVLSALRWELTKQQTGQLWLHHTGLDATRGYGTKTREWLIDNVMVAEKLDHPDADASFTLRFPKCRRRKPDNRQDFEPRECVLLNGRWEHGSADPSSRRRNAEAMPEGARMALAALRKALADVGTEPPTSTSTVGVHLAVTLDQWRDFFKRMSAYGADDKAARQKAFQRGSDRLVADGLARVWSGWVWQPKRDV